MRVADKKSIKQAGGNRFFRVAVLQDGQTVSAQMLAVETWCSLHGFSSLLELISDRGGKYVLRKVRAHI